MLILGARKGEKIYLNNGTIKIQVINICGNIVRLGFDLPKGVDAMTEKKLVEELQKLRNANADFD